MIYSGMVWEWYGNGSGFSAICAESGLEPRMESSIESSVETTTQKWYGNMETGMTISMPASMAVGKRLV